MALSRTSVLGERKVRSVTHSPEEVAAPPDQQVGEEGQEDDHHDASHPDQPARELADLLLTRDRALLQLQRAFRHPAVLRELLALRVANLAQQLPDLVSAVHAALLLARMSVSWILRRD